VKEQADQARKYSKFAEQLREAAQDMQEAARRDVLLTMADDYELMAAQSFIGTQMESTASPARG
jgi:ethanolamine utilization cobalamin adenosyltransferase